MDFSPAMLEVCAAKGFAAGLKRHDLRSAPWPYMDGEFDHVVCCGVLHFAGDLDIVFGEALRVLRVGGAFAFTTRAPDEVEPAVAYEREMAGPFEIFSHAPDHIEDLLRRYSFRRLKTQRCLVGEDLFVLWVAEKLAAPAPAVLR
jgi:predicted TPR repeat methyltransferase